MRSLILTLVALTGCHTVPTVVKVPISTPCATAHPPRPVLVTRTELEGMSDAQLVGALAEHYVLSSDYITQLEIISKACLRLPLP